MHTRNGMMRTSCATPVMPLPLLPFAPMVPAVCSPCPPSKSLSSVGLLSCEGESALAPTKSQPFTSSTKPLLSLSMLSPAVSLGLTHITSLSSGPTRS